MDELITEPIERVSHIERLPIFYTSQAVLLPFEDENKLKFGKPSALKLLKDALHGDDKMFGVSFLDEKEKPVLDRPPTGSIGTVAQIRSVNLSSGGGKIVKVSGVARYQIEEYVELDSPYPIAEVSFFRDAAENAEMLFAQSTAFATDINRLMDKIASRMGKPSFDFPALQPIPLTFLAADLFRYGTETCQMFLKMRSTSERFEACRERLNKLEAGFDNIAEGSQFAEIYNFLKNEPHIN